MLAACQSCKTCFIPHVCKCKERRHPHPILLRSISHVCKCKRCYYPPISRKVLLRVTVIVDLFVTDRSRIPYFFPRNVRRSNPSRFLVFSQIKRVLRSKYLLVMRPTPPKIRAFFQRRRARILPHSSDHFPCVFSGKMSLGSSDCEFTCDAASRSLIPDIFPTKTGLAGGDSSGSLLPLQRPNVNKGALI